MTDAECRDCQTAEIQATTSVASAPASGSKPAQKPSDESKASTSKSAPPTLPTEPPIPPTPAIIIEYCDRIPKAEAKGKDGVAVEPAAPSPAGLRSVTIIPRTGEDEGGIFRVWITVDEQGESKSSMLWDRKSEGRFPEPKELKQKIRDIIAPAQSLGHSDKKS
ncbi:hypothetical protein OC846_003645 [Tilletia horrida]|uniref:Uncharacterized protein n=1 Tax=Tilletia horrida TaxID=155126 RepID=A0AAN6GPN6_9BASI|nr:hypothetical protein OC845_004285 [Tilletia horrida]KAK0550448.1 hypothetical protein OC846_003645 [Tilletia horrida]KAK0564120.1 hypothetical protein OC861_004471 [Tilletia horrida]